MAESQKIPTLDELIGEAKAKFKQMFKTNATIVAMAPGRVNLIGEHTDYNDGFVMPMALPLVTLVVGRRRSSNQSDAGGGEGGTTVAGDACRIATTQTLPRDMATSYDFQLDQPIAKSALKWANYVLGVLAHFPQLDTLRVTAAAFDCVIHSSVPLGTGLSSSAALEVAFCTFLEALLSPQVLTAHALSATDKALLCQQAEHTFAGVPCGIMDQFISVMAQADHALMIDCRDLSVRRVPLPDNLDVAILIADTNVKHDLADGVYAQRRQQCAEAARILKVDSLRSATLELLCKSEMLMSPVVFRRARHVISENDRVTRALECLQKNDFQGFGQLMNESHDSLKADYEVSCGELDLLVNLARSVGPEAVLGSRMTGGGFGGCTVTLVVKSRVDEVMQVISEGYKMAGFYVCSATQGCKLLEHEPSTI